MARRSMSIEGGANAIAALVIAGLVGSAGAQPAPAPAPAQAIDQLEKALPGGWSLLITASELVIRHDRPCYVTEARHDRAPAARPGALGGGPLVTLELRYRVEPRWTEAQLAAARATNDELASELRALAARYHIDAIRKIKGRPAPASADERARLEAYEAAQAPVSARRVKLPRCSLGDASVFDGPDTYAQLGLEVEPPEVMTQAHRIVELIKQHCG